MKFLFGNPREHDQCLTIEAKTLDHAIKLFKIEELYPESYVAPEFIAKREYHYGRTPKHTFEWKGTPLIDIWVEKEFTRRVKNWGTKGTHNEKYKDWEKTGTISLDECINVDYATLLPQDRQLLPAHEEAAPPSDSEELLPIIGKASSLSLLPKTALRGLHDEITEKKRMLELEAQRLGEALDVLRKEVEKKVKMLRLLITFMGMNEEVVQIADGEPASADEPLAVFQQLLYCDEEIGIWEDGGLDIRTMDQFDKWVVEHIDTFLYRPRSVVAWKVRRKEKRYCENAFENFFLNMGNENTYLLIRNGQRIYRIWSEISVPGRLFPTKKEYDEIIGDGFGDEEYRLEKLKKHHETYMFGLVALQGLIERTEILGPGLRGQVNLIKNQLGGKVELIRDAEADHWIGDGHSRWRGFLDANRKTIEVGSRVVLVGDFRDYREHPSAWRTAPFRPGRMPVPTEICIVTEQVEKGERSWGWGYKGDFKTFYNPQDELWGWQRTGYLSLEWGSTIRKRRVPFLFYREDAINIDTITAEDCEYYERSRLDREDYLDLLRIIHFLKLIKLEERKLEEEFVKLIQGRLGVGDDKLPPIRERVTWWKLKNKWKRGLMADDAKALRMIERKCRKEFKA